MKKTSREQFHVTDERFSKLPYWTKVYIEYLEYESKHQTETLTSVVSDEQPKGSLISWSQGINNNHWLPRHTSLCCHLDRFRYIDIRFRGGREGEPCVLDINGSTTLLIKPQASNSIYINVEER